MRFTNDSKAAVAAKQARIIFVEGKDDAYFVDTLLDEIGVSQDEVGIIYVEGESRLEPELGILLKSSGYVRGEIKHIAIIRDCDDDPAAKSKEIEKYLVKLGLPIVGHGQIIGYDAERFFGLYLVPNHDEKGALEELLLQSVDGDGRLDVLDAAYNEIENNHGVLGHKAKRMMRMFISVLPIEPCGAGKAYREGAFPHDDTGIARVREFLNTFVQ